MKTTLIILTLILMGSTIYLIKLIKDEYGYFAVPTSAVIILVLGILIIITSLIT
jgi:uncharacterized membrane protein YqjE